ncbi:hypothetical protein ROHU_005614 [Labeo rohita]|uniref:Uncharacterized protein n=1 Tax=Labeo rohita TaxID=84645 RepID=A0A498N843_LABRO|nr:hypothetical protein ROHU_005614 [Labeo rohita]
MLAPILNRETTTGMDRVDDNTHLDVTVRNPGTIQDLKRVDGTGHGTSSNLIRKLRKRSMGIWWKLQGKATITPWSNQPQKPTKEPPEISL